MPTPVVYLTADNELEFRLSSLRIDFFMAFLVVGSLTISSNSIRYVIDAGGKGFTLYFDQAFFGFPISELPKLKDFLQQVNAAKAAA